MKLCMIGAKGHFGYVLTALPHIPHVDVVAISAGTPEDDLGAMRQWLENLDRRPPVVDDWRVMLDTYTPDILSVHGPLNLNAEICIEAIKRGIHVFCEKPVATTLEDLERLKTAYAKSTVHFASMMGLRYEPAFHAAWRAVKQGAVGSIRLINTRKSYKLGTRPSYYAHRETYGGTIPWVGSHAIDWIHWFSGESFQTVCASHSTRENRGHGDMEMSALCQFTLTNDVLASASLDFFRPTGAPSHGDDQIRVVGTKGIVEVRDGEAFLIDEATAGRQTIPASCDRQIFRDFVGAVEGHVTPLLTASDTLIVAEACLLARQSADERKMIAFP